jgi:3-deoxy-D-manno-octulosonic-acid transferase
MYDHSRAVIRGLPTFMYFIYSLLILVFGVIASPYLAYQALRYKKYIGSLSQRMGYLPVSFNLDGEESIWIHAVSVGEVLTARALIADLKKRYPQASRWRVVTCRTSTPSSIFRSIWLSSSGARCGS